MKKSTRTIYIELKKRCNVCGERQSAVYSIGSLLICQKCESNIVASNANDPEYKQYLESVKEIWKA